MAKVRNDFELTIRGQIGKKWIKWINNPEINISNAVKKNLFKNKEFSEEFLVLLNKYYNEIKGDFNEELKESSTCWIEDRFLDKFYNEAGIRFLKIDISDMINLIKYLFDEECFTNIEKYTLFVNTFVQQYFMYVFPKVVAIHSYSIYGTGINKLYDLFVKNNIDHSTKTEVPHIDKVFNCLYTLFQFSSGYQENDIQIIVERYSSKFKFGEYKDNSEEYYKECKIVIAHLMISVFDYWGYWQLNDALRKIGYEMDAVKINSSLSLENIDAVTELSKFEKIFTYDNILSIKDLDNFNKDDAINVVFTSNVFLEIYSAIVGWVKTCKNNRTIYAEEIFNGQYNPKAWIDQIRCIIDVQANLAIKNISTDDSNKIRYRLNHSVDHFRESISILENNVSAHDIYSRIFSAQPVCLLIEFIDILINIFAHYSITGISRKLSDIDTSEGPVIMCNEIENNFNKTIDQAYKAIYKEIVSLDFVPEIISRFDNKEESVDIEYIPEESKIVQMPPSIVDSKDTQKEKIEVIDRSEQVKEVQREIGPEEPESDSDNDVEKFLASEKPSKVLICNGTNRILQQFYLDIDCANSSLERVQDLLDSENLSDEQKFKAEKYTKAIKMNLDSIKLNLTAMKSSNYSESLLYSIVRDFDKVFEMIASLYKLMNIDTKVISNAASIDDVLESEK